MTAWNDPKQSNPIKERPLNDRIKGIRVRRVSAPKQQAEMGSQTAIIQSPALHAFKDFKDNLKSSETLVNMQQPNIAKRNQEKRESQISMGSAKLSVSI